MGLTIVDQKRAQKARIIEEMQTWMTKNLSEVDNWTDKIKHLTLYAMGKYLVTRRTGREYAEIIYARLNSGLTQSDRTDGEIKREKGGYYKKGVYREV